MSTSILEQQISKLGHRLQDVRCRAMESLLLKLDSDLLSIDVLCSGSIGTLLVKQCMKWLSNDENRSSFHSALFLLDSMLKSTSPNTECIDLMLDEHFPSFLHRFSMDHQLGHHEVQRVESIIGALISCPRSNASRESKHEMEMEPSPLYPMHRGVTPKAKGMDSVDDDDGSRLNLESKSKSKLESRLKSKSDGKYDGKWRFPVITLIGGDVEHLFDLSLRLKVQNESICDYALLQMEWLSIWHFPPEIVLQSDLHLFDSLLSVLRRDLDSSHLVTECLHSMTLWTQRMAHSLCLRRDPSTMSHPASKLIAASMRMDGHHHFDDYRHPNDFSIELINNRMAPIDRAHSERFEVRNALQCSSIYIMVSKLIAVTTTQTQLLQHSTTRDATFRLIQCVVDRFVFVEAPSDSITPLLIDTVTAFGAYTDSLDLDKLRLNLIANPDDDGGDDDGVSDHDVFIDRIVHFLTKCICLIPHSERIDIVIPSSMRSVLIRYALSCKLAVLYPLKHDEIKSILHRIDPPTHRRLQYAEAVLSALSTLKRGAVGTLDDDFDLKRTSGYR